jgi:D-methionine transport system ATP-binding protein
VIQLEHINKTFAIKEGKVEAVRDVSLSVAPGEIFGVIGFSGAGKSTLVRCINLLERPDNGTVTVGGQELTTLPLRELRAARKHIGMIFQHFNLMPSRTAAENIAYPLWRSLPRAQIRDSVRSLLDLVGIADKADVYPAELSGGQKQRVAIARALSTGPRVLLCDEATSALDPQATGAILQLLKKLNRELGLTIVVITHEMSVVKEICGRVAVMEKGCIVEQGSVFSIFANPKAEITRNFVRATSNLGKIDELLRGDEAITKLKPGELIVRLSYLEANVSEPLISAVSREFNLDINIIFADVELVQGSPIGGTVVIMSGLDERIEAALAWLREKNVGVEVLKDARVTA